MAKKTLGPQTLLYPQPAIMVGTNVDGKPNFATYAWAGIAGSTPPMISVAVRPSRYTLKGIHQNMTFSVNVPSTDLVKETDYCGTTSGAKTDKVNDCGFKVFYGKLGSAPLIEQCPINLECQVVHILNTGSHFLIIGRIEETYISDDCLTDDKPDIAKIKPLVFTSSPTNYHTVTGVVARAYSIGKELKKPEGQ